MKRYWDEVLSATTGLPSVGATVAVFEPGTTTPVVLYSANDVGSAHLTNPVVTGIDGTFYFYVADGTYDLAVTSGSITITSPSVEIYDLDELSQTKTESAANAGAAAGSATTAGQARDAAVIARQGAETAEGGAAASEAQAIVEADRADEAADEAAGYAAVALALMDGHLYPSDTVTAPLPAGVLAAVAEGDPFVIQGAAGGTSIGRLWRRGTTAGGNANNGVDQNLDIVSLKALNDAMALFGYSTYPLTLTGYDVIEYVLDDAGEARIVSTIGTAGAITYETPQSPELVLETELLAYIGAEALYTMPPNYPIEAHVIADSNGDWRVSYAETVDGKVLRFADNPAGRGLLFVNYNPAYVASGVDRRLSVGIPSPNPKSVQHIEHIWLRSTDVLATGTWRRTHTYASTILDRTSGLTAQGLKLSGDGYSGPGPHSQSVDGTGHYYDPPYYTAYSVAPFNFQGGGDIHKNSWPISWRLFIDGAEWNLALPYVGEATYVRIEYEWKVLSSVNPPLASTDNGTHRYYEVIELTPERQLEQCFDLAYQQQYTGGGYSYIECFDAWPDTIERTYPRTSGGVSTAIERITLAAYNAGAAPGGNNLVKGVDWIAFSNAAGYRAQMRVSSPNSFVAANSPWSPPVLSVDDYWTMKIAGDDPFKVYWYHDGPNRMAVVGGTATRAAAGDRWQRKSNIFYELP